jgi:hypothetical protein
MPRFRFLVLLLSLGAFLACGKAEYEFSSVPCYFIYDNSTHLDPTLASALNQNAPGIFCYISQSSKSGATYVNFSTNQGLSSSQAKTALDNKYTYLLGLNNGIIVGYGNLSSPAILYAYDHQCPNCASTSSAYSPKYPLTMTTDGKAKCAKCGRIYDMNNGGVISDGDSGNKMTRYRVSSAGPLGLLRVNN